MLEIDFLGRDWQLFHKWLEEEQQDVYRRLVNSSCTEDETQRLRGRALFIDQLLDLHNNPAA